MTDTDSDTMVNSDPDPDSTDEQSQFPSPDDGGLVSEDATRYLYWGAFATLLLLALIATIRFYLSASNAISIWIAPDFVPVFQAVFNLAVVLGCVVGLSLLVRRMAT